MRRSADRRLRRRRRGRSPRLRRAAGGRLYRGARRVQRPPRVPRQQAGDRGLPLRLDRAAQVRRSAGAGQLRDRFRGSDPDRSDLVLRGRDLRGRRRARLLEHRHGERLPEALRPVARSPRARPRRHARDRPLGAAPLSRRPARQGAGVARAGGVRPPPRPRLRGLQHGRRRRRHRRRSPGARARSNRALRRLLRDLPRAELCVSPSRDDRRGGARRRLPRAGREPLVSEPDHDRQRGVRDLLRARALMPSGSGRQARSHGGTDAREGHGRRRFDRRARRRRILTAGELSRDRARRATAARRAAGRVATADAERDRRRPRPFLLRPRR